MNLIKIGYIKYELGFCPSCSHRRLVGIHDGLCAQCTGRRL